MLSVAISPGSTPDRSAKLAGLLLVLTAVVNVVMVFTRLAADADQPTLMYILQSILSGRLMYSVSGIARLASGITFLAAGWLLLRTWIIRGNWATPLVPYLFVLSGGFTAISGACAILIAVHPALESVVAAGASSTGDYTVLESLNNLRWITGKVGFSAAGVALIVAARYQWRVGDMLRKVAPVSAVLGIAMQSIWLTAATVVHPVVGTAFILWLLLIGTMLATGRVERHFIAVYTAATRDNQPGCQRRK